MERGETAGNPAFQSQIANRQSQIISLYPSLPPPIDTPLVSLSPHPCPYLPDRVARDRGIWAEELPAELYQRFMDAGFRRSGKLLYQPVCRGCRECRSIRVPVATFRASKSQRRCARRNADLKITIATPSPTDEKFDLYCHYLTGWHGRQEAEDRLTFETFLYDSPLDSLEFEYRDPSGQLLATGICDPCPRGLSSVYFYFDPSMSRRGLGTFGALTEIAFAARTGLPYYYLGYHVAGCPSMQYKADFRPNELLHGDGVWRPA